MQKWTVDIEDAERHVIASRVFDTYEEASAAQDALLRFTWYGFWAAPIVRPLETKTPTN